MFGRGHCFRPRLAFHVWTRSEAMLDRPSGWQAQQADMFDMVWLQAVLVSYSRYSIDDLDCVLNVFLLILLQWHCFFLPNQPQKVQFSARIFTIFQIYFMGCTIAWMFEGFHGCAAPWHEPTKQHEVTWNNNNIVRPKQSQWKPQHTAKWDDGNMATVPKKTHQRDSLLQTVDSSLMSYKAINI